MDQLARLTEALAGRYRIEREIGSGGMASVFSEALKRAETGSWGATGGFAGSPSPQGSGAWSTKLAWSLMGALVVLAVGIILWPEATPPSSLSGTARTTLLPLPAAGKGMTCIGP